MRQFRLAQTQKSRSTRAEVMPAFVTDTLGQGVSHGQTDHETSLNPADLVPQVGEGPIGSGARLVTHERVWIHQGGSYPVWTGLPTFGAIPCHYGLSDTLGNVSATAQFEDNAYRDTSAYYLSQGPAPIVLYKSNVVTL